MWTFLVRVDPKEQANRWYAVGIQGSLFDRVAVIRFWGSREKDYQQVMVQAFESEAAAREAALRLIRTKIRGGYRVVAGDVPTEILQDNGDSKCLTLSPPSQSS